jgi:benzoyl-CoA reductase/2-hydroxyglutaryl-CoA dehydratase subunit BcrC/BadD/HgdB
MNNLTELMDISFYSNEISVVEGLDACTKLNVLSLGNNKIDNLEQMYTYLKKFKRLEVLNIGGNPFIKKEADYKILIMLHLAHLKYLDYTFLDENDRRELKEDDKLRGQL